MILQVKDLKMHFPVKHGLLRRTVGQVKAVDGVSFSISRGETVGLVGESGCGKTTVGKCVVRLLQPIGGAILFEGRDIACLNSAMDLKAYRRKTQMIFQDPFGSLNPRMTVSDIVGEGLVIMNGALTKGRIHERVSELLDIVGLSLDARFRYPHEFSGGQRQRIGIARALAVNPQLLVCDEPVSALDVSIQAQIINLLEDLQERFSLSYLFVAHDLSVVRHIADRIVVMYRGKVMEEAATEELFSDPRHPYTQMLFASIPSFDPANRKGFKAIPNEPQISFAEPQVGCGFSSRCPSALPGCKEGEIQMVEVGKAHRVRCTR